MREPAVLGAVPGPADPLTTTALGLALVALLRGAGIQTASCCAVSGGRTSWAGGVGRLLTHKHPPCLQEGRRRAQSWGRLPSRNLVDSGWVAVGVTSPTRVREEEGGVRSVLVGAS